MRSALRRCIDHIGKSTSGNGAQAAAMAELLDTFKDAFDSKLREPLLTSCPTPVQPSNDDLNIGLHAFRS